MSMYSLEHDPKTKLTLSVDKDVIQHAKEAAQQRKIPVSRLVENYLKFLSNPEVYCFSCGEKFKAKSSNVCPKCGWLIHAGCEACRCTLSEETASAVFYMRKLYEDLLGGRVE